MSSAIASACFEMANIIMVGWLRKAYRPPSSEWLQM